MSARVGTALCPGPLEHLHSLESPAQATEFQISEKWIPCGVLYSTPNFLYFLFPLILLLSHHLHSYEGRVPLNPMLTCSFLSGQHSLCGLVVLNAKHSRKKNSILSSLKYIYSFSISGLELPRRKNMCFVEKEEVGWLDVKVTHFGVKGGWGGGSRQTVGIIRPEF